MVNAMPAHIGLQAGHTPVVSDLKSQVHDLAVKSRVPRQRRSLRPQNSQPVRKLRMGGHQPCKRHLGTVGFDKRHPLMSQRHGI